VDKTSLSLYPLLQILASYFHSFFCVDAKDAIAPLNMLIIIIIIIISPSKNMVC
jgi:hypothetical protein